MNRYSKKLTPETLSGVKPSQCRGLVWFFFEYSDEVVRRYRARGNWFALYDIEMESVADHLLRKLLDDDRRATLTYLSDRLNNGKAWYWSALYMRHLLWQNGIAGNRAAGAGFTPESA
ncbi:hypothetical protein LD112_25645 [Pantoea agglomerans]|nr:hypothetical protein [Pantoea agglomerans]